MSNILLQFVEILDGFFKPMGTNTQTYLLLIFALTSFIAMARDFEKGLFISFILYVFYIITLVAINRVSAFSVFLGVVLITILALVIFKNQTEGGGML